MENLYLVVGLGNPGPEYARTRHNAGFLVLDNLAEQWRVGWAMEKKFNARLAKTDLAGRKVILCQPQTFMNASGEAVARVARFYDAPAERVLVVVDDADLPLGHIRLRPEGGNGGHHGLESIEQHLATRAYPRLRIGIGRHQGAREITGHVLGRFSSTEAQLVNKVLTAACAQVQTWLEAGIQKAMSQFNGIVSDPAEGKEQ
jgi:peptidyl-tRNA hydrolase, PTH1 family